MVSQRSEPRLFDSLFISYLALFSYLFCFLMQSNVRSHVDRLCWNFVLVFVLTRLWHCHVTGRLLFLGNDTNAPKLGEVKGVGYFWYWFMFNWAYWLAQSTGMEVLSQRCYLLYIIDIWVDQQILVVVWVFSCVEFYQIPAFWGS